MGSKRSEDRATRKLTKVGGKSIAVTLPIHLVRELKWREKQKVTVTKRGKKFIIEDWKK